MAAPYDTTPGPGDNIESLLKKILQQSRGEGTGTSSGKQYSTAPDSSTIQTSNATVFTLSAGEVGFIQNLDTDGLAVKKGAGASSTSLNFVLAGGTAADDGKGGATKIDDWIGAVSVAAVTGSPRFIAWKQTP